MNATTLKLSPQLKARIAPLARRTGKSPHAWMVDALEREADLSEVREQFIGEALEAAAEIDAGGPVYAMEDVHAWVRARFAGRKARRPGPLRKSGSR